jgi:hypothetical protein
MLHLMRFGAPKDGDFKEGWRGQKRQKVPKNANFCVVFIDLSNFCGALWDFWVFFGCAMGLLGAWVRRWLGGQGGG